MNAVAAPWPNSPQVLIGRTSSNSGRSGQSRQRDLARNYFSPSSQPITRCSASTVQDFGNFQDLGNFVKVWINLVGQIVKLPPGLAKIWRLVSLLEELTVLPLDVVDNASSVETAMQAD